MPFFDKKCAKMSVFFCVKTAKIRWRLGAWPQASLAPGGWGVRPQIPNSVPHPPTSPTLCQILGSPLFEGAKTINFNYTITLSTCPILCGL